MSMDLIKSKSIFVLAFLCLLINSEAQNNKTSHRVKTRHHKLVADNSTEKGLIKTVAQAAQHLVDAGVSTGRTFFNDGGIDTTLYNLLSGVVEGVVDGTENVVSVGDDFAGDTLRGVDAGLTDVVSGLLGGLTNAIEGVGDDATNFERGFGNAESRK